MHLCWLTVLDSIHVSASTVQAVDVRHARAMCGALHVPPATMARRHGDHNTSIQYTSIPVHQQEQTTRRHARGSYNSLSISSLDGGLLRTISRQPPGMRKLYSQTPKFPNSQKPRDRGHRGHRGLLTSLSHHRSMLGVQPLGGRCASA